MTMPTNNPHNLKSDLKKLAEISDWFDSQEELDVEEGIQKVKQAGELIKACKDRLRKVENEFEEIKKDIESTMEE